MTTAADRNGFATVDTEIAAGSALGVVKDRGNPHLNFPFRVGLGQIEHIGEFFHEVADRAEWT